MYVGWCSTTYIVTCHVMCMTFMAVWEGWKGLEVFPRTTTKRNWRPSGISKSNSSSPLSPAGFVLSQHAAFDNTARSHDLGLLCRLGNCCHDNSCQTRERMLSAPAEVTYAYHMHFNTVILAIKDTT